MPEIQNQDAPQNVAENDVESPAVASVPTEVSAQPQPVSQEETKSEGATSVAPETPSATESKHHERLVESSLEASHSEVLPLSPIETGAPASAETATTKGADVRGGEKNKRHGGLRRGNAGWRHSRDNRTGQSVGIVENAQDAKETLSGKFVDGYDKEKEFRRARELRENQGKPAEATADPLASPRAQGWALTEKSLDPSRRHPQSNAKSSRGKLIIEPVPIPEQEKDPSFWQKFKAKILSIFGLKKKADKKGKNRRRGGKYRNKHGYKYFNNKDDASRGNGFKKDFRGGNRKNRRERGARGGNSGARPQNNAGTPPSAPAA